MLVFPGVNCKKRVIDRRNKYCGNYSFRVVSHYWRFNSAAPPDDESYTDGRVYYDRKDEKAIIHIDFAVGKAEGKILSDGKLDLCTGEGTFDGKSKVSFTVSGNPCKSVPALGGGVSFVVTGQKK